MLKGLDPLLTGELLHRLDDLGHGDVVGLVDRNFPAHRYGVPVVALRGADTQAAARAVLSVLPLDGFVEHPVERMEVDDAPGEVTAASTALLGVVTELEGAELATRDGEPHLHPVERFAFYERSKEATFFVQTGETVPYSCYLLRKGVV